MSDVQCPRCNNPAESLRPVDSGFRSRLAAAGVGENLPGAICGSCQKELERNLSQGSVLLAKEKAKEENRRNIWKARVGLLKKARNAMLRKDYADAAISYEKYMKALEIVFEVPKEKMTPELFKQRAATKELTVVVSVFWDLLRIYDTHSKYRKRQEVAAKKLGEFIFFTPISSDIIKKAESFGRSAKNKEVVDIFLKQVNVKRGRCFIATAAFNSSEAPEVLYLRSFRDGVLEKSWFGRFFVKSYYYFSPPVAVFIDRHPQLKPAVRLFLQQLISLTKAK